MDSRERVVKLHYKWVWNRFLRLVSEAATADDLAQEVFARLFRKYPDPAGVGSMQALLSAIAHNVFREFLYRKRRESDIFATECDEVEDPARQPSDRLAENEQIQLLQKFLQDLDPVDCSIVLGIHYFGMSGAKVASQLGMASRTVTYRHHRALAQLRRWLETDDTHEKG